MIVTFFISNKSFDDLLKIDLIKNKNLISFLRELIKKHKVDITDDLFCQLKEVNLSLWNIEDQIRIKEKHKEFDNTFIELARSVYFKNDKRAEIKKSINQLSNSEITEEKFYSEY